MAEEIRRLPVGVQSFEDLREGGFVYVDKTKYIYELARRSKQYFLSRPRRFGKSLFLSTLKAYWEGKRELFEGLEIAELEKDSAMAFETHPVFILTSMVRTIRIGLWKMYWTGCCRNGKNYMIARRMGH